MKNIYILMATYNGEKYLKEQLDSLIVQTYKDWILWIHDDNSSDQTEQIIKKYMQKYPEKIKLINDNISTGGATENFNYLLNNIDNNYEYIMFCDQDDIWLPSKIEITINKMREKEIENPNKGILIHTDLYIYKNNIIMNQLRFMDVQNLVATKTAINSLFLQNTIVGCTMMFNKKLLEIVGNIPKKANMHDWWIALVASVFGLICYIDKATIYYRQHENNTVGVKKRNFAFYTNKILCNQGLSENFTQLDTFYKSYENKLDSEIKTLIKNIILIPKKNFLIRRYYLIKYKIFKHGILRNIFLYLGIDKI